MHTKTTSSKTVDTVTAGASDVCAAAEVESARNAPERIKLGDVTIHRFNRSFGVEPNQRHIERLVRSISYVKLLHPITLVPVKNKADRFEILCGANRYWALLREREQDGYLEPGEYVIRWDLDSESPECLEIAAEENSIRLEMSPVEMANYIARLYAKGAVDQEYLGTEFGINRGLVNALCSLPTYFEQLPAEWKRDLQWVHADACDLKYTPVITASHWRHVAAKVKKANGVTDELRRIMEKASKEEWSSEKLRRELNVPEDDGDDGNTDEVPSPSCNIVAEALAGCAPMDAGQTHLNSGD